MNLRWLLGNFTDPQYELPRSEQFRLSWVAHEKYLSWTAFIAWTAVVIAPFIVLYAMLDPLLGLFGLGGQPVARLIAMGLLIPLLWLWSAWIYRYTYVKPIRRAMRDEGFDLCLECGYHLRGLPDDTSKCPECGAARPVTIKPS